MIKKILASSVLVPMLSLGFYATPALARHWNNGNDITVTNNKTATVINEVGVEASTGYNSADGGNGGNGGLNAGEDNKGNDDNTDNDGGNGGNGGSVTTGNATAKGKVYNKVNTDITKISCDCEDTDDITVNNTDNAVVLNGLGVLADTGVNYADGGSGGNGGLNAGDDNKWNDNNDGNDGGNGGSGNTVHTGHADAKGKVFNKVNTIVTRVQ